MPYRKIFIIAEAGVNHNGCLKAAKKMVDVAVWAGADAVKFQTFKAENIVTSRAAKAAYQEETTGEGGTQIDMLKKLELEPGAYKELKRYCEFKGSMFLSTPFDLGSIDLLDGMGMGIYKIPSGELTNLPYLRKIGALKRKVIISTGMAYLREVADALVVLEVAGTKKKDITVLHCNTEYPTPYEDVNLRAMLTIKEAFDVGVGYSDHTLGIEISIAAAALGAEVIEKHFTLDRNMEGPDHRTSLEPAELKEMIDAIRNIEMAMGGKVKRTSPSETRNKDLMRKSIVAAEDIKKGEEFTAKNITVKRPGTGISPMKWDKVLGKKAKRDFGKDEIIKLS